jgi:hypothetical protein
MTCNAMTQKGIPCKRNAKEGCRYCLTHEKLLGKVAIFESEYFPSTNNENTITFQEEMWKIVALHMPLKELCSLFLTCRTLFCTFTGDWLAKHPYYVIFQGVGGRINPIPKKLYPYRDQKAERMEVNGAGDMIIDWLLTNGE